MRSYADVVVGLRVEGGEPLEVNDDDFPIPAVLQRTEVTSAINIQSFIANYSLDN